MNNDTKTLGCQLYRMTWPMVFGVLAIMSNQLVDSAFIGQLGVQPLAAVGFTIPVYQMIIGVQVGLGVATTAVISIALGGGDKSRAKQLSGLVISFGFVLVFLLCALVWVFQENILGLLGAEDSLLPVVRTYWLPWLVSAWLGAMLYFGYSLFRANGLTMLPGMVMVVTSLLNIVLDPLFIFVFDMGLPGAAWATICAFGIGCIFIYQRLLREHWIALPRTYQDALLGIKQLGSFMAPSMVSQFMPSLSAMAATGVVAAYGANVVAAWGLGTRLEFFSIVIVLALTMALPPMIGRLRGQGEVVKIHKLVCLAVGFVLLWQLGVAVFWVSISDVLGRLLTSEDVIVGILDNYLWRIPLSYGALGVCMIMVSVSSAMGMPSRALTISILRLFACYLPSLWVGSAFGGLNGLFLGAMFGNFAAGLMGWFMYKNNLAKLKREIAP